MTKQTKRPRGRPVTTGRGRETRVRVEVTLSQNEAERITAAAAARHLTAATYLREVGLDAAVDAPPPCACGRVGCDRKRMGCHT